MPAWATIRNTAKASFRAGGRIIACLAKESDKLTPACKKVLEAAEKK
jgi:hypothetical protein